MSTTISSSPNRRTFISNNVNDNYVKTNSPTAKNNAPGNNYWKDTFEPGITQGPTKDYSQVCLGVPASTLLTENTKDSSVNCLDKASELIDAMPEEQRKNAEVVFLSDNRPGQEGKTGHVVIRDGDKIIDPMSNASYKSTKEYFQKNPQYSEAGALKAEDAKRILDTQPGSAERKIAMDDAKVPESLQNMMVADSVPGSKDVEYSFDGEKPGIIRNVKTYDTGTYGDVESIKNMLGGTLEWDKTGKKATLTFWNKNENRNYQIKYDFSKAKPGEIVNAEVLKQEEFGGEFKHQKYVHSVYGGDKNALANIDELGKLYGCKKIESGVTLEQLKAIMPNLPDDKAQQYLPELNKAMNEAGINTPKRQAAFLAQIAGESTELKDFEEIADGSAYEGRSDLGNTEPGDGRRYKGRGPIQLTGRANYRKAGEALGIDLEGNPDRAKDVNVAFRTAAWFWNSHNLNSYADQGNFDKITLTVNGGYNGKESRDAYYQKALSVLS